MKSKFFVLLLIFLVLGGCVKKTYETFGGLEKLKWGADVTDMKNFMENTKKAEYENYKINRDEKTLSMFFTGGDFAGEKAKKWELKSKDGKFFYFKIYFEDGVYDRLKDVLNKKLGVPKINESGKTIWKEGGENDEPSEKIILRQYEDEIVLTVEAEVK